MIARTAVDDALAEVRPLVQADGADLVLDGLDEEAGRIALRLDLEGVSCLECVLPSELLHDMVSDAMSRRVPGLVEVTLTDPRQ